jgi:preprotein translocase subunit SecA
MDYLRQSISLRGYAQKNPTQEYKRESFTMFTTLLDTIDTEIVKALSSVALNAESSADDIEQQNNEEALATHNTLLEEHTQPEEATIHSETNDNIQTYQRIGEKVGRNDPCHCGSGKKYKNCHG